VALQIRFGKEFVVEAALHPDLIDQVAKISQGLIGSSRRQILLRTLANHQVFAALNTLSASDFYNLTDAIRPDQEKTSILSPVRKDWEAAAAKADTQSVKYFGGIHYETFGCTHAHLFPLRPYEDYLNYQFPAPMTERLGEFVLNLAESADRCGVPVDGIAILAEPAVQFLSLKTRLNNKDDWPVAIDNMNNFPLEELLPQLEKVQ
jgi:hypothetical protein